ncbi:MAG: hypothetical protein BWY09_02703 [Candidatus Hydrogenedentes bacterium ADurb.Bin179]|nr:MAG: hypothetical protein BWY09_02703 [Candidatus Hydrogenedentes bacterium ADurb.Bin179]
MLIDVGQTHRAADFEGAGVGLLFAHDHAEKRGLAGAVRADHPDHAAARQAEGAALEQLQFAVGLADLAGHHNLVPCPSECGRIRHQRPAHLAIFPQPYFQIREDFNVAWFLYLAVFRPDADKLFHRIV